MLTRSRLADLSLPERIRAVVRSGDVELPPLPEMALQLMVILEDEEHLTAQRVADHVAADPAIAGALLRAANSALYAGMAPVTDLTAAVSRLGLKRVGSTAITLLHKGQFEAADRLKLGILHQLWNHAVTTALAARILAERCGDPDPEPSYLAGLFHDVGELIVLRSLDYLAARRLCPTMDRGELAALFLSTHAELGYKLLRSWRLPERICVMSLDHHDEETEDPFVLRIQAADALARRLGAVTWPDYEDPHQGERALTTLNLSEEGVADLEETVRLHVEAFKAQI